MSVYELSIDGSGAEAGANKIVKSFSDILAASKRMEGGVTEAANKMVSSFSRLSNVRTISREAISQLTALSSALSTFRGPSRAAVDNTSRFLSYLQSIGRINLPSGARLAAFLAAMTGYRGPTASAGRNTQSLLRALTGFTMPSGIGTRLTSFLTSLGSFRGPSPTAGRNTLALLRALSSFSGTPPNLRAAVTQFMALARAVDQAANSMSRLRRNSSQNLRMPTAGGRGSFNPRQYAGDLNLMHNALVRTNTALNALGGILAARSIITASNDIIRIRAQLEAATGSVQQARVQFGYLRRTAEEMGLEFTSLARSYGFFLGSIRGTNVTMAQAREIFTGFSVAARALQLSTADLDGVFRALGQIMSKGKLQAEELRQQLGDRLPGAFVMFARALNLTRPGELDDALKRGAISGQRLTDAILTVSRTLQQQFSPAAEQMSRTVDAAFNRLKNSFTFAAEGLGRSGLNEGIIKITDSLRRILESQGLATVLGAIGAAFKFVGDNANFFLSILTGGLVAYTLRSAAAAVTLTTALRGLVQVQAAAAIGSFALAVGNATQGAAASIGVIGRLRAALSALFILIRAHPFVFIATAVAGLIMWLNQLGERQAEQRRAMQSINDTTADATNITDVYIERMMDLTSTTDEQTRAFRENTQARLDNAMVAAREARFDFRRDFGMFNAFSSDASRNQLSEAAQRDVAGITVRNPDGTLRMREFPATAEGFRQRTRATAQLMAMTRENGGYANARDRELLTPLADTAESVVNTLIGMSRQPGWRGPNFAEMAQQDYGDYNREAPSGNGISGDPLERPDRGGAAAARQYEQDIRRALEAMRDLRREITTTEAEMYGYLEMAVPGTNRLATAIEAQARAAAEARVNNFMDSFSDVATANRGLVDLNNQIRGQVDILEQLSPAARQAREELISFIAAEEQRNIQMRAAAEVGRNIQDLRRENELQRNMVDATRDITSNLSDANIENEVSRQLWDVAADQADILRTKLTEQLREQRNINRELEYAQQLRAGYVESLVNADISRLMGEGIVDPSTIDAYRELLALGTQLQSEGYTTREVNDRVRLRTAILEQNLAMQELQQSYERIQQLSQDQADAFVDAFRTGIEEGQSFLRIMGNIFDELKRIILDFVLYNPLRRFLTDIFQQQNAGLADPGGQLQTFIGGRGNSLFDLLGSNVLSGGGAGGPYSPISTVGGASTAQAGIMTYGSIIGEVAGAQVGQAVEEANQEVVVVGQRQTEEVVNAIQVTAPPRDYFSGLRNMFSGQGANTIKGVFTQGISKLGETLPKALGAAGQAFGAYTLGKGLAKSLGLGRTGSEVIGGAAAGFSLGGPIGAAIGAVAGLGKALLFKPKMPSSFGAVTVGEDGFAAGGAGQKYGSGSREIGAAAAKAGASLFNRFALDFDANLRAGNYGTFGQRKFKVNGQKQDLSFYSVTGNVRKGKPRGVEGVDWIKGSESEVQAFALLSQIRRGMITGLSETMNTIARNTTAKTMEDLQADFSVGTAYDDFIKASFKTADLRKQVNDLNDAFNKLSKQSRALGLNEAKLAAARDRLLGTLREEFNFDVQQGILEIENPAMAAYNQLVKDYRDAVDNAMAVGGDLAAVEKLFGLKRKQILEEELEGVNDEIRNSAKDLLRTLTATTSSPLAAGTSFRNAQSMYFGLRGQLMTGNTSNVENLTAYASSYLETAREVYGSSTQYFQIFKDVTDFLAEMSDYTSPTDPSSGGGQDDLPELPSLQSLIDEINARNQEMIDTTAAVGVATVEGDAAQIAELQEIGFTLEQIAALLGGGGGGSIVPVLGGSTGSGNLTTIAQTVRLL